MKTPRVANDENAAGAWLRRRDRCRGLSSNHVHGQYSNPGNMSHEELGRVTYIVDQSTLPARLHPDAFSIFVGESGLHCGRWWRSCQEEDALLHHVCGRAARPLFVEPSTLDNFCREQSESRPRDSQEDSRGVHGRFLRIAGTWVSLQVFVKYGASTLGIDQVYQRHAPYTESQAVPCSSKGKSYPRLQGDALIVAVGDSQREGWGVSLCSGMTSTASFPRGSRNLGEVMKLQRGKSASCSGRFRIPA